MIGGAVKNSEKQLYNVSRLIYILKITRKVFRGSCNEIWDISTQGAEKSIPCDFFSFLRNRLEFQSKIVRLFTDTFTAPCRSKSTWDMRVNPNKSSCVRFGALYSIKCRNILTSDNCKLVWRDNVRYLGVYLRSARSFACSYSYAKKGMYRAFNAVFGKVGRVASADVVVHLVKTKCLPMLYYAIEVCPTNKSDVSSLQYVNDTCFRKIFNVKSKDVVHDVKLSSECSQSLTLLT